MEPINRQEDINTGASEYDLSKFRDSQRKLFTAIISLIIQGAKEIGIHLHIRGGKTMLMRILAKWAVDSGQASVALIINNRSELRKQCADPAAFKKDCKLLSVKVGRKHPSIYYAKTDNNGKEKHGTWPHTPWENDEYIISVLIQTLIGKSYRENIMTWIESVMSSTGKPVIAFIDEAQEFGVDDDGTVTESSGEWQSVISELKDKGVILISLSGFPWRQDGLLIPGFAYANKTEEVTKIGKALGEKIRDIDEKTYEVETIKQSRASFDFDMVPMHGDDFIFGLDVGFRSGALCEIDRVCVDRNVTLIEDGRIIHKGSMAGVSESNVNMYLRRYVTSEKVIADACAELEKHLLRKREVHKDIKAMVFTCTDLDGGKDDHAAVVASELDNIGLTWVIATSNSDESISDILMNFKTDGNDVLILKNAGRVGYDCPPAKVLADLSTVRNKSKMAQTHLRISTPYKDVPGTLITPDDVISEKQFELTIGNSIASMRKTRATELGRDTTIVTLKDRDMLVGGKVEKEISDNHLRHATAEQQRIVDQFVYHYPAYSEDIGRRTAPQQWLFVKGLLDGGLRMPIVEDEEFSPVDVNEEIARIRREVNGYKRKEDGKYIPGIIHKITCKKVGVSSRKNAIERGMCDKYDLCMSRLRKQAKLESGMDDDQTTSMDVWEAYHKFWLEQFDA